MDPPSHTVSAAWSAPQTRSETSNDSDGPGSQPTVSAEESTSQVIATVNGQPIQMARLQRLLMLARGADVLETLLGLEATIQAAAARGITVTQADVDKEHDRALRLLVNPLSSITPGAFDIEEAEQLLEAVLSQRNVSREEYRLVMRRNAHLRKIVELDLDLSTESVRREAKSLYGRHAVVRHIQLTSLRNVNQTVDALDSGKSFAELARRLSANTGSAGRGGLLEPFSEGDESVPAVFRQVAFSLTPGEVSGPVRLGEWYHLITLERIEPAQEIDFDLVRSQVEQILRQRKADQTMFAVFEKLFRQANIDIDDPALSAAFDRKLAGRGR